LPGAALVQHLPALRRVGPLPAAGGRVLLVELEVVRHLVGPQEDAPQFVGRQPAGRLGGGRRGLGGRGGGFGARGARRGGGVRLVVVSTGGDEQAQHGDRTGRESAAGGQHGHRGSPGSSPPGLRNLPHGPSGVWGGEAPSTGIEPVAYRLGGGRSIQLSYEGGPSAPTSA